MNFQTELHSLFEIFPDGVDRARFLAQLKRHEGERLAAYLDSVGVLTVGVGHNCEASPVPGVNKPGDKISRKESDELLLFDIQSHAASLLNRLPWILELSAPRRAVLLNMAFNLGVNGLLNFRNTLALLQKALNKQGSYQAVANGMLASKWAGQVGRRAYELAVQMRTGEWQEN